MLEHAADLRRGDPAERQLGKAVLREERNLAGLEAGPPLPADDSAKGQSGEIELK